MWTCLAALPVVLAVGYARFGVLRRRRTGADNRTAVWESQLER
ncbi:MAG TPA: hypothetical protein VKB80_11165 [Kofleriaceae bacterium]|nr:hypothetical protein [Kofleriaceae bacterium]